VSFRTVHSSKGLEADYVVLPNVGNGQYGFPSQIADDPVLNLVMPQPDGFPHAEERRLFYVALTRARREVVLVATRGRESPFIAELAELGAGGLVAFEADGTDITPRVCPMCRRGMLVMRTGSYGEFHGCSRFPACTHKEGGAWPHENRLGSQFGPFVGRDNPF
jgi:DNA helicase-4